MVANDRAAFASSAFSGYGTVARVKASSKTLARRALRETYKTLDTLPANERIAFVLRFIDGLTLPEAAAAAGTSLATFKRRLSRAEKKFLERVRERPLLQQWLQGFSAGRRAQPVAPVDTIREPGFVALRQRLQHHPFRSRVGCNPARHMLQA